MLVRARGCGFVAISKMWRILEPDSEIKIKFLARSATSRSMVKHKLGQKMQHIRSVAKHASPYPVSVRCPSCRQIGTFAGVSNVNDVTWDATHPGVHSSISRHAGIRICPKFECRAIIFVVVHGSHLLETYPRQLIDFDPTSLPKPILKTLEEAVLCHGAGAYRACALMVRRVLEELCEDRKATGANLFERLKALKSSVILPDDLLEAANELRLLGNDAAHIEAKTYDEITEVEAALALELAKELLKAVYQYASLVARMRAMKKPAP